MVLSLEVVSESGYSASLPKLIDRWAGLFVVDSTFVVLGGLWIPLSMSSRL